MGATSEATPTSLKDRAAPSSAKFASTGRTKAIASLREANSSGEPILVSPTAKKLAFKVKPRAFQPKKANIQLSRVSALDRFGPVNTDLRVTSRNSALKNTFTSRHPNADKRGVNL